MPINCARRQSIASITSITSDEEPFDLMDLAFKVETNPLRIDLSGDAHCQQQQPTSSRCVSACSSLRSTEFQIVLDGFSTLELKKAKPHEDETSKCIGENGDPGQLLQRRRNSEISPGDLVRVRRKSLPSLGLVAVDIQCSVPTKMSNSQSFPSDMTRSIMGGSMFGLRPNQRRASCSKIAESPSEWRIKVHERSLDIGDDDDRLYPHLQTRRSSYAGFSSYSRKLQGGAGLLPSISCGNSILENGKQFHIRYNGM
ncbi:hypothetical protein ACROYT_G040013 [Oculina patagonica]